MSKWVGPMNGPLGQQSYHQKGCNMKVRFYNILWDTETDDIDIIDMPPELPNDVILEMYTDPDLTDDENICEFGADTLSDKYGFCVHGYCYEIVKEG